MAHERRGSKQWWQIEQGGEADTILHRMTAEHILAKF